MNKIKIHSNSLICSTKYPDIDTLSAAGTKYKCMHQRYQNVNVDVFYIKKKYIQTDEPK